MLGVDNRKCTEGCLNDVHLVGLITIIGFAQVKIICPLLCIGNTKGSYFAYAKHRRSPGF